MKQKKVISLILFITIIQLSLNGQKYNSWKLVKDKNGIKAYTSDVDNLDVKKVKVKTNMNVKLSSLTSLVKDVSNHKNWMYNCISTKLLKVVNDSEYFFYTLSSAPWPVYKRDIITHTIIKQEKNTKKVSFFGRGEPNYLKKNEGIVRIKSFKSVWEFIPKQNGTVDIIFYLQIDVGGVVPAWAMNLAIAEGPFQTVQNLKKEVKKEKYKNAKLSFIEEL